MTGSGKLCLVDKQGWSSLVTATQQWEQWPPPLRIISNIAKHSNRSSSYSLSRHCHASISVIFHHWKTKIDDLPGQGNFSQPLALSSCWISCFLIQMNHLYITTAGHFFVITIPYLLWVRDLMAISTYTHWSFTNIIFIPAFLCWLIQYYDIYLHL